jgi:hypothetical protein
VTSTAHALQEPAAPRTADLAEAARYALLRRLAPSMRHHLVVNLQPIGMVYEVMDRRLRMPEPNIAEVHESAHKINGFARAALNSCLDVVTWLAPEENRFTTTTEGVRECMGLLATSFTFRGYALRNEVPMLAGDVPLSAMRNVLTSALLCMTDQNPAPADLRLTAQAVEQGVRIDLELRPTDGDHGFATEPVYRRIEWDDVQALADAESVELARDGRQRLGITIPWMKRG